jgi:hypothetical protein
MPPLEDLAPIEYAPGLYAFAVGWLAKGLRRALGVSVRP